MNIGFAIAVLALGTGTAHWEGMLRESVQLQEQGQYGRAADSAAALVKELEAASENGPVLGRALNNLAAARHRQGWYDEAEALYQRAMGVWVRQDGFEIDMAATLGNLANLHISQARYQEALDAATQSLAVRENTLGANHPDVATALNTLGEIRRHLGRHEEASVAFRRAIQILDKHPSFGVRLGAALQNLAAVVRARSLHGEARQLLERALSLHRNLLPDGHPTIASTLSNLGELHTSAGRYPEAEGVLREALSIWETSLGPHHVNVAVAANNLAQSLRLQGRNAEAEPLYRRAIEIWESALGPNHPDLGRGVLNLAALFAAQGKHSGAERLYRRAMDIFTAALGPSHPEVAVCRRELAALWRSQGRFTEARKAEAMTTSLR